MSHGNNNGGTSSPVPRKLPLAHGLQPLHHVFVGHVELNYYLLIARTLGPSYALEANILNHVIMAWSQVGACADMERGQGNDCRGYHHRREVPFSSSLDLVTWGRDSPVPNKS
ncbi:hypothetical protein NC652_031016 [Populus alba x Populus x berolinensis]|nr:hypothetical protein NC652_031010 [Populus alba x Populus x berolinensis]KAJ6883923.1 hypothetical protein NC652_031016 [Populus alba x Populus x berolinensis]